MTGSTFTRGSSRTRARPHVRRPLGRRPWILWPDRVPPVLAQIAGAPRPRLENPMNFTSFAFGKYLVRRLHRELVAPRFTQEPAVISMTRFIWTSAIALTLAACGEATPSDSAGADNQRLDVASPDPASTAAPEGPATPDNLPTPGSGAPYPIVLLHGMGGFDKLKSNADYFNGVVEDLGTIGEDQVFTTAAPPFDDSEVRAAAIAPQIEAVLAKTGKAKVNIIAHSQGGLDARVLASPAGLKMGKVTASITTISTPHHGSTVGDLVLKLMNGIIIPLDATVVDSVTSALLDMLQTSFYQVQTDSHLRAQLTQLSQAYMESTFNPKFVDDPGVVYASYGGRTNWETGVDDCSSAVHPDDPTRIDVPQLFLLPTALFLQGTKNVTNDGLVTVKSSRWGTFLQCIPADHFKAIGQLEQSGTNPLSGFDHLEFYRTVVARIRAARL